MGQHKSHASGDREFPHRTAHPAPLIKHVRKASIEMSDLDLDILGMGKLLFEGC
jgi:hypothetical protein